MSHAAELRRAHARDRRERYERLLDQQLDACGVPPGEPEYRFDPVRRWRFDRAWPSIRLAVEVDGVLYGAGGRHQRPAGYARDAEKHNAAQLAGWRVLRFTPAQVKSGAALDVVLKAWFKLGGR